MNISKLKLQIVVATISLVFSSSAALAGIDDADIPMNDGDAIATMALATGLTAASAANYALRHSSPSSGVAVINCSDVVNAIKGGIPDGYTITSAAVAVGRSVSCTLTGPGGITKTFTANGIQ